MAFSSAITVVRVYSSAAEKQVEALLRLLSAGSEPVVSTKEEATRDERVAMDDSTPTRIGGKSRER